MTQSDNRFALTGEKIFTLGAGFRNSSRITLLLCTLYMGICLAASFNHGPIQGVHGREVLYTWELVAALFLCVGLGIAQAWHELKTVSSRVMVYDPGYAGHVMLQAALLMVICFFAGSSIHLLLGVSSSFFADGDSMLGCVAIYAVCYCATWQSNLL